MVNCHDNDCQETIVEQTQIIDLENAAYLPHGRRIQGMLAGSDNWRSPEAHFKGALNKPTDIFSFGIVVCVSPFLFKRIIHTNRPLLSLSLVYICLARTSHLRP